MRGIEKSTEENTPENQEEDKKAKTKRQWLGRVASRAVAAGRKAGEVVAKGRNLRNRNKQGEEEPQTEVKEPEDQE